mmetsp:Transcript_20732/g.59194  ORF Transcript_20732/g.59194 Transcript_20732/m.59194 type:complete len:230 (+) Transcript_20732:84-773(+)
MSQLFRKVADLRSNVTVHVSCCPKVTFDEAELVEDADGEEAPGLSPYTLSCCCCCRRCADFCCCHGGRRGSDGGSAGKGGATQNADSAVVPEHRSQPDVISAHGGLARQAAEGAPSTSPRLPSGVFGGHHCPSATSTLQTPDFGAPARTGFGATAWHSAASTLQTPNFGARHVGAPSGTGSWSVPSAASTLPPRIDETLPAPPESAEASRTMPVGAGALAEAHSTEAER